MSYPSYNAGPYPPQAAPQAFPGAAPYLPQGTPPAAPGYQPGGYQPTYGQTASPPGGYPAQQPGGYQQTPPAPGGYAPNYAPNSNQGYQPPRSPQPGYSAQPGYGAPALYPSHSPAPQGYGAPPPPGPGYGQPQGYAPPAGPGAYAVPPPVSTRPVQFRFRQDEGFDSSGTISDEAGKVVYKLKDESDKHTWTKYLKSRPLKIERGDKTPVATFDWKDGPSDAKITAYVVWSRGEKVKLQVEGEILDQDWKFKLPNGNAYEWQGPGDEQMFELLDHQQVTGEGFDVTPKVVGRYSMHTETRDATLDLLPEALAVPDLLDVAVITSFYLEYFMWSQAQGA